MIRRALAAFRVWWIGESNPFFFDGQSLPSLMRQVRAAKLEGTDCRTGRPLEEQTPKPYCAPSVEPKKKNVRYMRRRKIG